MYVSFLFFANKYPVLTLLQQNLSDKSYTNTFQYVVIYWKVSSMIGFIKDFSLPSIKVKLLLLYIFLIGWKKQVKNNLRQVTY